MFSARVHENSESNDAIVKNDCILFIYLSSFTDYIWSCAGISPIQGVHLRSNNTFMPDRIRKLMPTPLFSFLFP
jgi:hypothetical protein